jgi:glyoxylase I family protein
MTESRVPRAAPAVVPLGLDHIVIRVRDQAASQRFYTEVLGCTVERVNPETSLLQIRCGEHIIDLVPGEGACLPEIKRGLVHFCISLACDDVEGLAATLKARGIAVDNSPKSRTGAYGRNPSFYIRDPDGYHIELKPRV